MSSCKLFLLIDLYASITSYKGHTSKRQEKLISDMR